VAVVEFLQHAWAPAADFVVAKVLLCRRISQFDCILRQICRNARIKSEERGNLPSADQPANKPVGGITPSLARPKRKFINRSDLDDMGPVLIIQSTLQDAFLPVIEAPTLNLL
jgi:hypothetical protein